MRPVHLAVALAALALGASACGSSGGGESPASANSSRSRPGPTQTSPAATASMTSIISPSASAPASSSLPKGWCGQDQLRVSIDPRHIPGNGTPGPTNALRHGVLVDFENTSSSTCVLRGYPGAAIVDEDGEQVTQAERTLRGPLGGLPASQEAPPIVALDPGEYAAALLEGLDQQEPGAAQAGCDAPKYPRILITPPNTRVIAPFSVGWPRCYSFTVHPVRALPDPPQQ